VPGLGLVDGRPLDQHARELAARFQHLAHRRLDPRAGRARPKVAHGLAVVVFDREPVHLGELGVHAPVAQVGADDGEAERRLLEQDVRDLGRCRPRALAAHQVALTHGADPTGRGHASCQASTTTASPIWIQREIDGASDTGTRKQPWLAAYVGTEM
jgi:hypothetical protein